MGHPRILYPTVPIRIRISHGTIPLGSTHFQLLPRIPPYVHFCCHSSLDYGQVQIPQGWGERSDALEDQEENGLDPRGACEVLSRGM